ncbi:MAG: sugar ABC transporter ATP-binding protein [Chloroflexota bacterium]|nr:sugar ABC transporter ATP-binding protein [Chloroflexota bacterium]
MTDQQDQMALEAVSVSKAFPGVQALDDVSLSLKSGEIHALVGENGAGKSTLIKIITGLYGQDTGSLRMEDDEVKFGSPRESIEAGIASVPQERNLIPEFSVGENILLERMPLRGSVFVDYDTINREAARWLKVMELDIPVTQRAARLSAAEMQQVEIVRALALESRVLLLDEPTASITPHEAAHLFEILRSLRDRGVAVLVVTHKLEEVFELCDRVTVLRDGKNVASGELLEGLTRDQLVSWMIGRTRMDADLPARPARGEQAALTLQDVDTIDGVEEASLEVFPGEILGLYGLVGAGRTELAHAVIGASEITAGSILVDGQEAKIGSVAEALGRYRIGYVSEDRKNDGLILSKDIVFNVSVPLWRRLARQLGWVPGAEERAIAARYAEELDVRTPSLDQTVGNLSGGNQQKVSIAKWLAAEADILIFDEPTIGIDIKTKEALHELIWGLAASGKAVLLISSDMPEMVRLADRILVMKGGRIVAEIENSRVYDEISEKIMQDLA